MTTHDSDSLSQDRDLIQQAKKIFTEHGGAKRDYFASQQCCGLGALMAAMTCSDVTTMRPHQIYERMRMRPTPWKSYHRVRTLLHTTAKELYGNLMQVVNDELGTEAVLHVYDLSIKRLDEELNHG